MELFWALLALGSALAFGIRDIIAKKFFKKNDLSPIQLTFEEFFLIFILSFFILFKFIDFNAYRFYWDLFLLKGIFLALGTLLYFKMLKKYEISTASPILNLSPLFVLILSNLFLGEKISLLQLIGIFLILISTYLLEITIHHHDKSNPHKNFIFELKKVRKNMFFLMSLSVLIFMSLTSLFDKIILETNEVNIITNMYFSSFIIIIILSIYYIKESYFINAIKNIFLEPKTLIIGFFAALSNFLILYAMSLPSVMLSLIIALRRTSSLFSSIIGGLLFHEKHLKQKTICVLGMLFGIVLIVI